MKNHLPLFKTVLLTFLFLFSFNKFTHAQTLLQAGATDQITPVSTGNVNTWEDVASIEFTSLNEAKEVMVIANFETDVTSGNSNLDTKYRLSDGSNLSAEITRHIVTRAYDDSGLGAVVHIFSYDSPGISSGTFTLQHQRIDPGNTKEFSSRANMVAIVIDDATNSLPNSVKATTDITTSPVYEQVTGSITDAIVLTQEGSVYISAAFSTFGSADLIGDWVLRSSTDGTNFTEVVESGISRSNTTDAGAATFTMLLENQPAGNNYYDVAHKTTDADELTTQNLTLIAVGLENSDGLVFPTFKSTGVSNSTTSLTPEIASSVSAPASENVDNSLFAHATFNMSAPDPNPIIAPQFSLGVTNATFTAIPFTRYIPAGATGSGGLVGLATNIALDATPVVSLNHKSDGTNLLETLNINLVGFYLRSSTPISLSTTDEEAAMLVKVIPMFISNRIKVTGNLEQPATITIYDILGRLMLSETLKKEDNNEVNVSALKKGIYIVKVKTREREFSTKIAWF